MEPHPRTQALMRLRLPVIPVAVLLLLGSFAYGVLATHYQMFPYPQLRVIKQSLWPDLTFSADYYDQRAFFERFGGGEYDVVFAGDSLVTEGPWSNLAPGLRVANRGIWGDRTDGLRDRLDNVLATSAPRVFLMIGINDFLVGREVDAAFADYQKIVARLVAEKRTVFLQSTILAGPGRDDLNPRIVQFNTRLEQLASQHAGVTFIDLNARLAPNGVLEARYTPDNIHLNVEGYSVWREMLVPYLN